jgi:Dolichyl-phosphate-mannose-protein mannosyltransferase
VSRGSKHSGKKNNFGVLFYLAGAILLIHLLTAGRYGFHRDELATLDDARHLAWGYVAYPPVTPFFGRLSLELFGTSLTGFRFFAALAGACAIFITGLMVLELGGTRTTSFLAALAATPFALACGSLMQYVAFDYLCWVSLSYCFLRLCKSADERWWLPIGVIIGLGMLTKYSMLFCVLGIAAGVLFSPLRRRLASRWLLFGIALSLVIFLPNLLWQIEHHFISLDFLRHIHARDVRIGRTKNFLLDQVVMNQFGLLLALAGLYFYFFSPGAAHWRPLGWLYLVPFVLFLMLQGRGYYLAPAYPVLFAGGAVWLEQYTTKWRPKWSRIAVTILGCALAINIAIIAAVVLPLAPINSKWWKFAVRDNEDLAEEIGWPELVETIAKVRDSLPDNERATVGILAGNYGEAGAINLYGAQYHLPRAISGINSFWARGYGDPPPETIIVVGFDRDFVERYFESWRLAARNSNHYGIANEESTRHPDIFVCRGLRMNWNDFWKTFQRFG